MSQTITITFTVPDNMRATLVDDYCAALNYSTPDSNGIAVTKAEYMQRTLVKHIKTIIRDYRINTARVAADKQARDTFDAIDIV